VAIYRIWNGRYIICYRPPAGGMCNDTQQPQ